MDAKVSLRFLCGRRHDFVYYRVPAVKRLIVTSRKKKISLATYICLLCAFGQVIYNCSYRRLYYFIAIRLALIVCPAAVPIIIIPYTY